MNQNLNIVLIYADDLGWGDLGCYGSIRNLTPNLDALAAAGIRFTQWYSNSPVCSPSRAALLTGRYPENAGVFEILGSERGVVSGLPRQSTIASMLRNNGYVTGIFGKWHLGTTRECWPDQFGFDEHFGFLAGCLDYYSHIYYFGQGNPVHDLWDGGQEVWRNGRYLTDEIADRAVEFIGRNRDRPFLCYVPFNAPHYPMHAAAEYVEKFRHLPQESRMTAAVIAAMDAAIGRIMNAVNEAGIAERTVVLFSSDNGPSTESRNWLNGEEISYRGGSAGILRGFKGSVFEGGIRVPLIAACPGLLPVGQERTAPGAMMDLLPTLLEGAGIDPEQSAPSSANDVGLDGVSLWGYWANGDDTPRPRVLHWDCEQQWAVRDGRWKLVVDGKEALGEPAVLPVGLFDLDADPSELRNLVAEYPDIAGALMDGPTIPTWARSKVRRAIAVR